MIGLGGGDRKRTIHDCALEGDIVALENLVREKPTLLRSKDDSGREAFHWAVSRGHAELAGKLFDQVGKAAVDTADDDGWTPLIIAASAGHNQLVEMLLDNGANVNATTSQGRTALLYSASKGREELTARLIDSGADTNLRDQLGATPLHRASGPGHTGVVRLLLAADKTIVDCQDKYGNTALHYACEEERNEVARLLISHGANREVSNREEKTPFDMCSPGFARALKN